MAIEVSTAAAALRERHRLVASRVHTVLVIVVLGALAYFGAQSEARLGRTLHPHRVRIYLFGIAEEWLLFALVVGGVLRARVPVSSVVGERWHSYRGLLLDIGIAAVFWVWATLAVYLLAWLLGAREGAEVRALIPRDGLEIALWLAVSVSAGICEETICRGYLQRQFIALTGSRFAGILCAAVAFGLMHLYQGWRGAILIGVFGLMLGVLAYWRRSVRPGMIAHAWHDAFGGVLGAILLRH